MTTNIRNFKIIIEYDGGRYHGWQRQRDQQTVQGEIEKVIHIITQERVDLIGSGRTDTGVHARGQVANFLSRTKHPAEAIQKGMNSLLPDDIVIREMDEVTPDFHAQFWAKRKTYHYHIRNTSLPCAINRQYAWFIRRPLNVPAMNMAAAHLTGTHDFKSFETVGSPRTHTTRTIFNANVRQLDDIHLMLEIESNGFLRHMVRNIMGTLVDVGLGRTSPDRFKEILLSKDRRHAGSTAPPHGLFLMQVVY